MRNRSETSFAKINNLGFIESPILSEIDFVSHGFFTRLNGRSSGEYSSLNCSFKTGDKSSYVISNRLMAMKNLGLSNKRLLTLEQVHGNEVLVAEEKENVTSSADGIVSFSKDIALGILTADCVPVLLADAKNRIIGAFHAGWRGLKSGIVEATIEKMIMLGASAEHIRAALGPSICYSSFEVGKEFSEIKEFRNFLIYDGLRKSYLFNLSDYVLFCLRRKGIISCDNIGFDTYKESGLFFSYRRSCHLGEDKYGCQISIICMV